LTHKTKHDIVDKKKAVVHNKNYLAVFGEGCDILINDNCDTTNNSHSDFGSSYACNPLKYGSKEA
jgi:hypothetical protein